MLVVRLQGQKTDYKHAWKGPSTRSLNACGKVLVVQFQLKYVSIGCLDPERYGSCILGFPAPYRAHGIWGGTQCSDQKSWMTLDDQNTGISEGIGYLGSCRLFE